MRFSAIDQVRGAAIVAMIVAHFGPGFWERIQLQGVILDAFALFGRLATPTFIAIFGFTIAFAYLPKAQDDPVAMRAKLFQRSGKVLAAALVTSLPQYMVTLNSNTFWGDSLVLNLILNSYGILLFYALAIFVTGLFIGHVALDPYMVPTIAGAVLIFLGTYLGHDAWGYGGQTARELARLVLVSGKYAFLVNFGMVLMLVGFAWHIRSLRSAGFGVNRLLLASGLVLLLVSLSMGRIVGWRSIADLQSGFAAPPQIWYLCAVLGIMLIGLVFFDKFSIPALSFFLEHTGRNPLAIYVAHAFVLPLVELSRFLNPGAPDVVHIAMPLFAFLTYWAKIIIVSNRVSVRLTVAKI